MCELIEEYGESNANGVPKRIGTAWKIRGHQASTPGAACQNAYAVFCGPVSMWEEHGHAYGRLEDEVEG